MAYPNPLSSPSSYSNILSPYPLSEALTNQFGYDPEDENRALDHQDDNLVVAEEEEGESDSEAYATTVIPLGWKWIEVASCFDRQEGQGGGGFAFHDVDGTPLLAQAFPLAGESALFVEALTLRKAIMEIMNHGEEQVMFCVHSSELCSHLLERPEMPRNAFEWLIFDISRRWDQKHELGLIQWPPTGLAAARWLARCGRTCQQYCQWTGPWPEELEALL